MPFYHTCFPLVRKVVRKTIIFTSLLGLLSCQGADYAGPLGEIDDLKGGAAADEPRAVLIARDILSAGGNAADAMVALYFSLSVTMPHLAGLGGGGLCIAHNRDKKSTELIQFLPPQVQGLELGLPGNARGMAALWARYGSKNWGELVGPGANLASLGIQVSRSLAKDLSNLKEKIAADPALATLYLDANGNSLAEGALLVQPDLGAALGAIRSHGGVELNSGPLAQKYADSLSRLGYPITTAQLRAVQASILPAKEIELGDQIAYVPQNDGAEQLAAFLEKPDTTPTAEIPDPDMTGAVTFDNDGNAVACIFTLNEPFGIGRIPPGTGFVPAALTKNPGMVPLLLANRHNGEFYFAGTSGGTKGISQLANVLSSTYERDQDLESVMLKLTDKALGTKVNAAFCPKGSPTDPDICQARHDPRGNGLASLIGKAK